MSCYRTLESLYRPIYHACRGLRYLLVQSSCTCMCTKQRNQRPNHATKAGHSRPHGRDPNRKCIPVRGLLEFWKAIIVITCSLAAFVILLIGNSCPVKYWIPLNITRAILLPSLKIVSRMSSSRRQNSPSRGDSSMIASFGSSPWYLA